MVHPRMTMVNPPVMARSEKVRTVSENKTETDETFITVTTNFDFSKGVMHLVQITPTDSVPLANNQERVKVSGFSRQISAAKIAMLISDYVAGITPPEAP